MRRRMMKSKIHRATVTDANLEYEGSITIDENLMDAADLIEYEKVALFDSEGALLMNLGVLASVAGKKPKNFVHFLLDNGCYATTGGQPVPNADNIDYAGLARAAGYASTHSFTDLEDFVTEVEGIMEEEGPVFVAIKIVPEIENLPIGMRTSAPRRNRSETIRDLRRELGIA